MLGYCCLLNSFLFWAGQRKPEHWKAMVYISLHRFMHLHLGPWAAAPPPDVTHGLGQGLQRVRQWGCRMLFSMQTGFAQTCREPSGFCESCVGGLIYPPLPRNRLWAKAHPHYPSWLGCCIRKKKSLRTGEWQLWDQASPVALETSPISREKTADAKKAESAPTLPFWRSRTGN